MSNSDEDNEIYYDDGDDDFFGEIPPLIQADLWVLKVFLKLQKNI